MKDHFAIFPITVIALKYVTAITKVYKEFPIKVRGEKWWKGSHWDYEKSYLIKIYTTGEEGIITFRMEKEIERNIVFDELVAAWRGGFDYEHFLKGENNQ